MSTGDHQTGEDGIDEFRARFAALEDRVDELETTADESVATSPTPNRTREAEHGPVNTSPNRGEESHSDASEHAGSGVIEDALAGWGHGRTQEEREASHEVAEAALEWLQETPKDVVRKADVPLERFADEDPLDEPRSTETLWTEVVRDAWQHAAERSYVEQPHSRGYRWSGE